MCFFAAMETPDFGFSGRLYDRQQAADSRQQERKGRDSLPALLPASVCCLFLRDDLDAGGRSRDLLAIERLEAAAEALREELLGAGVEVNRVLGTRESVPLIRIDDVGHAAVVLLDRADDLL